MHSINSAGVGLNVLMENVGSLSNALNCSGHALYMPYPILAVKCDGQLEVCDVTRNVPSQGS